MISEVAGLRLFPLSGSNIYLLKDYLIFIFPIVYPLLPFLTRQTSVSLDPDLRPRMSIRKSFGQLSRLEASK